MASVNRSAKNLHNYEQAALSFSTILKKNKWKTPQYHIVLGSVLGTALKLDNNWKELGDLPFSKIKGLLGSTAPGHPGKYKFIVHKKSGKTVVFQMGRLHGYEGLDPRQVVLPVIASKLSGVENFILTNAAGSLRLDMVEGSVMVLNDHVNLTGKNPLVGENPADKKQKAYGPRFPDMATAYDKTLSAKLYKAFKETGLQAHRGTYLGLLGPNYETPAEVRLFSSWGMDAVGMSTVWETIALRHLGAKVAGASLMTNMGCGLIPNVEIDHEKLLINASKAAEKVCAGILHFLSQS